MRARSLQTLSPRLWSEAVFFGIWLCLNRNNRKQIEGKIDHYKCVLMRGQGSFMQGAGEGACEEYGK